MDALELARRRAAAREENDEKALQVLDYVDLLLAGSPTKEDLEILQGAGPEAEELESAGLTAEAWTEVVETAIAVVAGEEAKVPPGTLTTFTIAGYEAKEKLVLRRGRSGGVSLPPSWIGKKVRVIRIDP